MKSVKPPECGTRGEQIRTKRAFTDVIEKQAKPRNRTWKDAEAMLESKVIPHWGDVPLRDITRRDVVALVEAIADDGKPYMANRVLACVSKLFSWALVRGLIDADPAAH